jgi:hypothetical protein
MNSPKVIPHRPQHPELGRRKAGVVFGHGHAPGADIAGNINFALGHGIGRAVAGVAVDVISAPAFSQPTSSEAGPSTSIKVLGNPMDPRRCPGGPSISDVHRLSARTPDASTDAVLAERQNFQASDHRLTTASWIFSSSTRESRRWPSILWPEMI